MSSARRYCCYRGVPVDYVDDVLSEARLRAATTLRRRSAPPEDFPAWFLAVTRHTIADYWKVKGPEVPLEDWMWRPQSGDLAPEADATVDVGQFFRRVGPLLSPRDQRMLALYLRVANRQMTQVDMAKELGAEPKGAAMLLKGLRGRIQDAMLALAYLDDPGEGAQRCDFLASARSRPPSEELRRDVIRHVDGGRTKPSCPTCRRRRNAIVAFVSGIASALPIPADLPAPPPKVHLTAARRGHGVKATLAVAAAVAALMAVSAVSVGNATYHADPRAWPVKPSPPMVSDTSPTTHGTTVTNPAMPPSPVPRPPVAPTRTARTTPAAAQPGPTTPVNQLQGLPTPPVITAPAVADSEIGVTCGHCGPDVPTSTQFSVLVTAPGVTTVEARLEINGRTDIRSMRNVPGTSTWVGVVGPYRPEDAGGSVSISVVVSAKSGQQQSASVGAVAVVRCGGSR